MRNRLSSIGEKYVIVCLRVHLIFFVSASIKSPTVGTGIVRARAR